MVTKNHNKISFQLSIHSKANKKVIKQKSRACALHLKFTYNYAYFAAVVSTTAVESVTAVESAAASSALASSASFSS